MPITFIDIERQKNWRIGLFFCLLIFLYFLFAFIIAQTIVFLFGWSNVFFVGSKIKYIAAITAFALTVSSVHFGISAFTAVDRVVEQIRAGVPDDEDGVHRVLLNVMDEIHIASGSKRQIRCLVIPTLSLNALAVTDLKGDAVIAITEGLLSRLKRDQLEAVMAHEAYHIFSGDCLEASVATSLFGVYAAAIEGVKDTVVQEFRAVPFLVLFWFLNSLGEIVTMFISREREYRADAGAVRITRNPVALAEALNLIAGRWSGSGFIHEGLEMLCISSPIPDHHDESEDWWDDLMSTHPPIGKRVDVLLQMARVSHSTLAGREKPRAVFQPEIEQLYYALDSEDTWIGPFRFSELTAFPWFTGSTKVSMIPTPSEFDDSVRSVDDIVRERIPVNLNMRTTFLCPACRQPLMKEAYVDTSVDRCVFCRGVLIDNDRIFRILARREIKCDERFRTLMRAVTADSLRSLTIRKQRLKERKLVHLTLCPRCGRSMFRSFYSYAFLIELDKCSMCRVTWFDADELDMLQCLIENKITDALVDRA